jgi:hypothetical protein
MENKKTLDFDNFSAQPPDQKIERNGVKFSATFFREKKDFPRQLWNMKLYLKMLWRRGLVVTSPPATEEIGAMGREIESRQGIGW